jgi:hypothetical protein
MNSGQRYVLVSKKTKGDTMKIRMRLLREGQEADNLAAYSAFLALTNSEHGNASVHQSIGGEPSDCAEPEYIEYDSFYRRIGVL